MMEKQFISWNPRDQKHESLRAFLFPLREKVPREAGRMRGYATPRPVGSADHPLPQGERVRAPGHVRMPYLSHCSKCAS